ncbi:hypothetical protein AHiyo6_18370 [Arthrobacter sp. Hiyo6]|nr:hypothetical protein AHiyo6_18370 [Arthrobacter sp. Hiyo6]
MPAGAAKLVDGLAGYTENRKGPGTHQRGVPGLSDQADCTVVYFAVTPATGTCATPPAAFLEPRRSIQMARRETEKLIVI